MKILKKTKEKIDRYIDSKVFNVLGEKLYDHIALRLADRIFRKILGDVGPGGMVAYGKKIEEMIKSGEIKENCYGGSGFNYDGMIAAYYKIMDERWKEILDQRNYEENKIILCQKAEIKELEEEIKNIARNKPPSFKQNKF